MRVDFSEIRKIPIASVLAMYKVELRKRSETELVACCPLPSHEKAAHKQWTLAISTEKNKGYCHSDTCRAASNKPKGFDQIDFVGMMENRTPLDAAKKLAEMFCVGTSKNGQNGDVSARTVSPAQSENPPSRACNLALAFTLKDLVPDHPFILERGISKETAVSYGVGFFPRKGYFENRICFAIVEDGKLVGYAGRTILPVSDTNPKWLLPKGLIRSFVYGIERCDPAMPLILCESPWGCLHFSQHHAQAAALVGTTMTEQQERRLEPFKEIVIAMDNDLAGHEAAEKLSHRLKRTHKVRKAYLNESEPPAK